MNKEAFEAELSAKIEEAKELVRQFRTSTPSALLDKLEQDIRAAFQQALGEAPLSANERVQKIRGRSKWESAKANNPGLTPVKHIMDTYPDRKELGMIRRDLNDDDVDPQLYQALADWLRPKKDGTRNEIPADFCLPKKSEATDIALHELYLSAKSLTSNLGPADARLARAVSARHSRTYRSKAVALKQSPRWAAE